MKNIILTSLLLTISTTTFAASTGTLVLQGVVPQVLSISVTAQSVASALDLSTTQSNLNVASVNEQSNSKTGYKVTISSANLGQLKRTDGNDVFAYSMQYNGAAVQLTNGSGTTFTSSQGTAANLNKAVSVSYTGVPHASLVQGTYADTVTFSIAAN